MNFSRTQMLIAGAIVMGGIYYISANDDPWGARQRSVEAVVAAQLRDPSSAQFRNWVTASDVTCGEVNGQNGFGAYTGFQGFVYEAGQVHFNPTGGALGDASMGVAPPGVEAATRYYQDVAAWARLARRCYG